MTYASKRITVACLLVIAFIAVQAIPAHSLDPASPELVGQLTQGLSVTPQQATGGAGALFGLAKSKLSPADFGKIAAVVPGMDSFLKAAPSTGGGSGLSSLTDSLPGNVWWPSFRSDCFSEAGALTRYGR